MSDLSKEYHIYLKLERGLSENSVEAYEQDIKKLYEFRSDPEKMQFEDLQDFLHYQFSSETNVRSQARILSGIRSFYKFLIYHHYREDDPSELLEWPKKEFHIPEVLTVEEINALVDAIDLSKADGHRNRAIIEMLYGSGLRVSELTELKLSCMYRKEGYMLIHGKGDKERLVPISPEADEWFGYWMEDRSRLDIHPEHKDIAFLNRNGKQLTRMMIFTIIKRLAAKAGIQKTISPHTIRHSFATHLLQNGADLRIIQQLLGHENITTTEIYTHIDIQDLKETILKYHPVNQKKS